jgi:hypothetical protein
MSSSVADGTTLKRKERNEQGNMAARIVDSTFPRVILTVHRERAHVAERVRGLFEFAPDSA